MIYEIKPHLLACGKLSINNAISFICLFKKKRLDTVFIKLVGLVHVLRGCLLVSEEKEF